MKNRTMRVPVCDTSLNDLRELVSNISNKHEQEPQSFYIY